MPTPTKMNVSPEYKQKVKEWYPEDKPHKRPPYDERRSNYKKAIYKGWDYFEDDALIECPYCNMIHYKRNLESSHKTEIDKVFECYNCKKRFTL